MAQTKPCKYCQHGVAMSAKQCPSCGGADPYPYDAVELLPVIVTLIIFVVLGIMFFNWLFNLF